MKVPLNATLIVYDAHTYCVCAKHLSVFLSTYIYTVLCMCATDLALVEETLIKEGVLGRSSAGHAQGNLLADITVFVALHFAPSSAYRTDGTYG